MKGSFIMATKKTETAKKAEAAVKEETAKAAKAVKETAAKATAKAETTKAKATAKAACCVFPMGFLFIP